eukprot:15370-Rhodomonas_salina.9
MRAGEKDRLPQRWVGPPPSCGPSLQPAMDGIRMAGRESPGEMDWEGACRHTHFDKHTYAYTHTMHSDAHSHIFKRAVVSTRSVGFGDEKTTWPDATVRREGWIATDTTSS